MGNDKTAAKVKICCCQERNPKEMMDKIVFVLPDMPGGGSERVVALLANEYSKRGIKTAILLFAGHETAYRLEDGVEVVSMGEPSKGKILTILERLHRMRNYYKENRGCQIWSFCVMGAFFSVLAALGQKHYFLVSERTDPDRDVHKKLRNFAYRFADVIVCQTKESIRSFPRDIARRTVVLPNPVDVGDIRPYDGEREKRIVSVGRLQYPKNHQLLFRAFAGFVREFPDYTLELYGKGKDEAQLRELAARLGISGKVVFHGFSSRVKEEITAAAMYVLSSDYEGVSNSMLEAIALGIPVIATDCPIGGCRMYIEDGINGLLVPVGAIEPLTEAMKKIASDQEFARKLSMEGRKLREQNNIAEIADRFLRV